VTNDEALAVVKEFQEDRMLPGTLEALETMRDHYGDLTKREAAAYDIAFAGFRRLFYGAPGPQDQVCKQCHKPHGTHHPACDANPAYRAGDWS
jgi:hypothetical protein